jgi:hypothetical protein
MNAKLRNFAIWLTIVLLLLVLFMVFRNPGQRSIGDVFVPLADAAQRARCPARCEPWPTCVNDGSGLK